MFLESSLLSGGDLLGCWMWFWGPWHSTCYSLQGLETDQISYLLFSPWTQQSLEGFEMLWALLTLESLPDLLYIGSPWPGKGGGSWATLMHASSSSLEVRTRLCPLSSGLQHVKGVLLFPYPMLKWTVLYMGPLWQQRRNNAQNLGTVRSFLHLAQGSLWKKQGKITDLLGLKKWPADRCGFFFPFFFSFFNFSLVLLYGYQKYCN